MRALLVEDSPSLSNWIAKALRHSGLVVDRVDDGVHADQILQTQAFDIVLLDLTLPRMDGVDVLKNLRARKSTVPVLILTARNQVDDRVRGLDAGADDYLAKPFALSELEARIRALVRRAQGAPSNEIVLGDLRFDARSRQFHRADERLDLTPRERAVLEALMTRANTPVSKADLSGRIVDLNEAVSAEAIEIHIHRLRKKLDGAGVVIRTLRGLGYMIELGHA